MKQKDLLLITVVAVCAAIFAFLISNFLLASENNLQTNVEEVPAISSTFPEVDDRYFNKESENPTQLIRIKENQNQNPFPLSSE